MKHMSLILNEKREVMTQFEAGYFSFIDTNTSLEPNHPKDVKVVVFDPNMEDLPVSKWQTKAFSLTMLDALDSCQPYMDVRTTVNLWKEVRPEIISLWVMQCEDSKPWSLTDLDLPMASWTISTPLGWKVTSTERYPWLTEFKRYTLKRK